MRSGRCRLRWDTSLNVQDGIACLHAAACPANRDFQYPPSTMTQHAVVRKSHLVPPDASVEMEAKKAAGYYTPEGAPTEEQRVRYESLVARRASRGNRGGERGTSDEPVGFTVPRSLVSPSGPLRRL